MAVEFVDGLDQHRSSSSVVAPVGVVSAASLSQAHDPQAFRVRATLDDLGDELSSPVRPARPGRRPLGMRAVGAPSRSAALPQ